MRVPKSTLEKISLSELTSLTVDSEPKVLVVAAPCMRHFLGQEEVVDLIVLEVVLTIFLGVITEVIVDWEETGALAHDVR